LLREIAVGDSPDGDSPDGTRDQLSDCVLVGRFARERDEASFRALVERHGGMVYHVCRRVLGDPHEAEDAFQATFLVLAQKAGTVRHPQLLANWLYGVAQRVASKAKAKMRPPAPESAPRQDPAGEPVLQAAWREVEAALDEELHRLPDKYRAPLVLCYLQGRTHEEAAALLNCQVGSMSWHIRKGRELLRKRLQKRGMAVSLILLLLGMSQRVRAAPALVDRTVAAACAGAKPAAAAPALAAATPALAAAEESRGGRGKLALALLVVVLGVGAAAASIVSTLPDRQWSAPAVPSAADKAPRDPTASGQRSADQAPPRTGCRR
jgi:RNA polymerase sigma factor (sigma-70 family)